MSFIITPNIQYTLHMHRHTFLTIQEAFLMKFILLLMCNIPHSDKPCTPTDVRYTPTWQHTHNYLMRLIMLLMWNIFHSDELYIPALTYIPLLICHMPLFDMPQMQFNQLHTTLYPLPLITHNSRNEVYTATEVPYPSLTGNIPQPDES